jgi:hypothetical protein
MTNINEIWKFNLRQGNSNDPRNGACLLDAVSWFEYGRLGDSPACVCPVIRAFARGINDAMNDADRQRLKVFIPRLVGTVDPEAEQTRAEYLAWQAIRVFAPLALDAAGLRDEAERMRTFSGSLRDAGAAADAGTTAVCDAVAARTTRAVRAARAAYAYAAYAAEASAATRTADAAAYAAQAAAAQTTDVMIAALDGVLKIGRQAELIEPARFAEANERFALARRGNF